VACPSSSLRSTVLATRVPVHRASVPILSLNPSSNANRDFDPHPCRYIHALDVVPYLPSLETYAHVAFGIWIPTNDTVVLEDRPPEDISNLNWCVKKLEITSRVGDQISGVTMTALLGTGSYTHPLPVSGLHTHSGGL